MGVVTAVRTKEFLKFIKIFSTEDLVLPLEFNQETQQLNITVKKITSKLTGIFNLSEIYIKDKTLLDRVIAIPSSKKLLKFLESLKDSEKIYLRISEEMSYITLQITDSINSKTFIYLLLTELEEKDTPINEEKIEELRIFGISLNEKLINEIKKLLKVIEGEDVKLLFVPNENGKISIYLQIGETINTEYAKIEIYNPTKEFEILKENDTNFKDELTIEILDEIENSTGFIKKSFDEDTSQDLYEMKLNKDDLLEIVSSLEKDNINTFSILKNGGVIFKTLNPEFKVLYGVQPLL
jgi:sulfur relay (sulfurtransferase) DsrF/TusC family protein